MLIVEDRATLSELLAPRMWVNNGEKIRCHDIFDFVSPSGHLDVTVRVENVAGVLPTFRVLRAHVAEVLAPDEGDFVAHDPQSNLWAAFANGEMIAVEQIDRASAERALAEFRGVL